MKRRTKRRAAKRKNPAELRIRNPSKRRAKRPAPRRRTKHRRPPVEKKRRRRKGGNSNSVFQILMRIARSNRAVPIETLLELSKRDPEWRKALLRYKRFHGTWPDSIDVVEAPPGVKYLVGLGETVAHEYRVPKSSGRSPGPPFRHAFRRGGKTTTATDPRGRRLYITKRRGSKLRVTDRGIVD